MFKPRYRVPMLASLADRLKEYAGLPGLSVCHRTVLTPERHAAVLKAHPDLTYKMADDTVKVRKIDSEEK